MFRATGRTGLILTALAFVAAAGFFALSGSPAAQALPPAGTDMFTVNGQVSIISLLGSETIPLSGTVTINRSDPGLDLGTEVVDAEIVSMSLTGTSVTGTVTITESPVLASTGEIRSLQPPPDEFPASSFFDVFIVAEVPAAPAATVFLHNDIALHVLPMAAGAEVPLSEWPPVGVTYEASPSPCVPLLPQAPAEACVTSLSLTIAGDPSTPTPTPTVTSTPTPAPTPTPKDPSGDTDGDTLINSVDPDDDNDGCTDEQEVGTIPRFGGLRDPHNFWDFFDPNLDQQVAFVDFLLVLQHFNTDDAGGTALINRFSDPLLTPDPGPGNYHPMFDRGPVIGLNGWNVGAPDGSVSFTDFLTLLVQFSHSCA